MSLKGRDFLSIADFSAEELYMFWDQAADLKRKLKRGEPHEVLKGRTLAMIFEIPSTRTRVSFETGMQQLGGHAQMISAEQFWLGKGRESVKDTGKVLSRYVDSILIRSHRHDEIMELANWADIPVINGASDVEHPCQLLADFLTTREKKRELQGKKTAVIWSWKTLATPAGALNSMMIGASKVGMDISVAHPKGYEPDSKIIDIAKEEAKITGSKIEITTDMKEAITGADVVVIKNWAPLEIVRMGIDASEAPHVKEAEKYKVYRVTEELLDLAQKDHIIQHSLPVSRDVEISSAILDGPHSVIYDEAENRLHTEKAVLSLIMD